MAAAAGSAQWRRFPFVERRELGAPPSAKGKERAGEQLGSAADIEWLASDDAVEITCATPGRRFAFLGDLLGNVHAVDMDMRLAESFVAHEPPIPAPPPPIPRSRTTGTGQPTMQRRDTREDAPRVSLRKAAAEGGIRIVGVTHIAYARDKNILVTAGEDKNSFPIVRVWNLDKMDRVTGRPQMLREIQASVDKKPIPITAIALLPALTHLAIGLENGVVVLVRGDLTRAERSTKTKTVYEGDSMVTGLLFAEGGQQGGAPRVDLVVVNRSRVVKVTGLGSGAESRSSRKPIIEVLDASMGTESPNLLLPLPAALPGTSTGAAPTDTQFLLARPEALHVFSSDTGRSSAWFVSESSPPSELLGHGEKAALSWYRGYFALVTRWPVLASGRVEGVSGGDEADKQVSLLTLYDLRNRFVSFSAIFTRDGAGGEDEAFSGADLNMLAASKEMLDRAVGIWAVWSQWGYLWVITDDKRIYRLSEKDLNTRLELLFRRSMYSLALAVVQSEQQAALLGLPGADRSALDLDSSDPADRPSGPYDYNIVTEIHKRYGDWLYSKADHDAAMAQYILTIPHLESSYVIRRFLDVQRTDQLTRYLEALHAKGAATPDHTTLLLNCYAKAKDEAKLSAFLGKEDSDLAFDVETAVAVCRSAGYARQALALAARYGHHDSHVAIQVEDLREYAGAVDYISNLPFADAARAAARYGAVLVDQVPEGMTEVLTRLCTGWYPVRRAARGPKEEGGTPKSALAAGLGISAGKKSPAAGSRASTPSAFAQEELGRAASATMSGIRSGLDKLASVAGLPVPGGRPRTPTAARGTPPTTSPAAIAAASSGSLRPSSWAAPSPLGAAVEAGRDERDALLSSSRPRDSAPGSTNSLPRANAAEFLQLFAGQSKVLPVTQEDDASVATPPLLSAEQVAARDEVKTRFCIRFLEEVLERRGKGRVYSAADVERSLTGQGGVQMLGLDEAESGIVDEAAVSTPAREASAEAESQLLWNTLLELYMGGTIVGTLAPGKDPLRSATPADGALAPGSFNQRELSQSVASNVSTGSRARSPVVQDWKPRAMALLKDPNANYDPDHSLVLCQSRGFSEGVLYLTEKLQLFNDLMRLHMQARNYPAVVAICLGHGDEHVALWTESLAYFAAEADDPRAQTELHRLLAEIDRRKLMPLLQVLQILSGPGSTVTIGMVRDYILKHVRKQKEQIEEDRKLTKEYQEETARMRQEIEDLQTKPVLFENTICSSCNQTLDLPSVHYYCKHSYHERCLPITDTLAETGYPECPKCEPNNRMVLEMIRSQEARAADPEQFRRAMAKNPTGDRWDVVAEWYGRNVFWTPRQSGSSILPSSVRK